MEGQGHPGAHMHSASRSWPLQARTLEFILVSVAAGLGVRLLCSPAVAMPPGGHDHNATFFIAISELLGVITAIIGYCALFAGFGPGPGGAAPVGGRRSCGTAYIAVFADFIYIGVGFGALFYVKDYLGHQGVHCSGRMSKYAGCSMLLASTVINGLGMLAAFSCAFLEVGRIKGLR